MSDSERNDTQVKKNTFGANAALKANVLRRKVASASTLDQAYDFAQEAITQIEKARKLFLSSDYNNQAKLFLNEARLNKALFKKEYLPGQKHAAAARWRESSIEATDLFDLTKNLSLHAVSSGMFVESTIALYSVTGNEEYLRLAKDAYNGIILDQDTVADRRFDKVIRGLEDQLKHVETLDRMN